MVMKCRRLVRDYERKTEHAEAMIHICMMGAMLRRLEISMKSEFSNTLLMKSTQSTED
jgi:hypothetical protein